MAKNIKTPKATTKTKAELTNEIEYLTEVSGFNEYVNDLEEDNASLDDEVVDACGKLEAVETALSDSNAARKAQADEIAHLNKALNFFSIGVSLAQHFINQNRERIAELEHDNFHLTIQRDALKDKVKDLNENPVTITIAKYVPVAVPTGS